MADFVDFADASGVRQTDTDGRQLTDLESLTDITAGQYWRVTAGSGALSEPPLAAAGSQQGAELILSAAAR